MIRAALEEAFGIIPLREEGGEWFVLLVKKEGGERGHWWGFPKGHPNTGESPSASAERELKEETGLDIRHLIATPPLIEIYDYRHEEGIKKKQVTYFLAEVAGTLQLEAQEISDARWWPLRQAAAEVTFPGAKELCHTIECYLFL